MKSGSNAGWWRLLRTRYRVGRPRQAPLRHAAYGQDDRRYAAIFAEMHPLDRDLTMIAVRLTQGTSVIDDIPIIRSRDADGGMVPRAASDAGVLL
jgi:hypothetical protein